MNETPNTELEAFLANDPDETSLRLLVDRLDNDPDTAAEIRFLGMLRAAAIAESELSSRAERLHRIATTSTGVAATDRTNAVMAKIAAKRRRQRPRLIAALALVVAALAALAIGVLPEPPPTFGVVTAADAGYDLVRDQITIPLTAGTQLLHNDKIRGGTNTETLSITDHHGTRIEVAGPVELACRRAGPGQNLLLSIGTLSLDVTPQPPEYPLIILTPHARATVVGTVLKIAATAEQTRLEVSEGAVIFANLHEDRRVVEAKQFAVAEEGASKLIGSQSIIAPPAAVQGAHARWHRWSRRLSQDPDLVVHYVFQADTANRGWLINQATPPSDPIFPRNLDGRIHQCTWSDGRFPGLKDSLLFQQDAYVNCGRDPAIPTDGPITCLAWFKPMLIRSGWTGIVTTGLEGWGIQLNKQFDSANFYYHTELGHENARSEQAVAMNEWHFAVGTFDGSHTRIYLDGQLLSSFQVNGRKTQFSDPLMIGGNFTNQPARSFQGWIDEVAVLRRVMSDSEIAEAYAAGRPD